jgi:hypothetical protein
VGIGVARADQAESTAARIGESTHRRTIRAVGESTGSRPARIGESTEVR